MTATSMGVLLRHLRKITDPSSSSGVSDAELLERFVRSRDEAAFELLVWRHQRLVLGVCRRVLGNRHDAEDAFQATFLALARKAAAVSRRQAVASWLHTVAYRIALRARAARWKKSDIDLATLASPGDAAADAVRRDLASVLDEEVGRLPEKYRVAVVLCYLEGKSYAEAGRQLGLAIGTLAGRLTRARALLRRRLTRRGIDVSGALLITVLCEQASSAAAPAALVKAATLLAAASSPGVTSAAVVALAEGALRSLFLGKLKLTVVALLAGFLVAGMGLLIPAALVSPGAVSEAPPLVAPSAAGKAKPVRVDDYGDPLPDGALRRLGTLRFRHGGGNIHNLLLTTDGKTLISNDYYGSRKVCVWELATGKLLHQFPGTFESRNIALSADGKLVAVGQKEAIVLWELASGKEVRRFAQADATGFAFSPDGKTLAAAGRGGIQLWNLATGTKSTRRPWRSGSTALLAYTPDGKTLIAGQHFGSKIGLWDVASGKKRDELDAKAGDIFSFVLSPDGATLATGSRQGGIPLWDVKTGKLVRKLRAEGRKECTGVAFSPDGKILAAIEHDPQNQDFLSLWDVATGKELPRFKGDISFWNVVFSRDGKTLIAGWSSAIRLWDVATGKEVGPTAGSPPLAFGVTASPDGRMLAFREENIRLWDMGRGREIGSLPSSPEGVLSLSISPDGKTLASGACENVISLWDIDSRKRIRQLKGDEKNAGLAYGQFNAVAFAPHGKTLASAGTDGAIRLWDAANGKEMRRLSLLDHPDDFCEADAVAFSPDGRTLAASGRGKADSSKVCLWDVATGRQLTHLNAHLNDPTDKGPGPLSLPAGPIVQPKIVFSPGGRMLAMHRWQKTIPVWEAATGRQCLLLEGHEQSTVCVAFAPDGRTLASASWDNTIRLWDLDTGRELRKLMGHRGKANSLAFSADGKTLVSAGDDTTVLFWDVADVTHRKRPRVHPLTAREWEAFWADLIQPDAAKAYAAMVRMTAAGPATATALKERLHPAHPVEAEELARLLKDLESDQFAVREKAGRELEKLADAAQPALRQTLARPGVSLDLRRRLEAILASIAEISGERLRTLRAIEVLERLDTPEARQALKTLAAGAPGARLTEAAKAALERLR
ncbi:MAG TPA: sigma-70 family RNA polymerase sigma factor [Gemmataceae bacterium]|jgi:RNA polymerase sigma factor (sigma-70 family)